MIDSLKRNRQNLARVGGSLLALILLFLLLKEESSAEMLAALRRVTVASLLAAILALLVSRIFVAARWHALLRAAGAEISFWQTTKLTLTGLFASNFLPTTIGGDVARLAGAMQLGYDRPICLASLIADRLIGMAGMAFAVPFGLIPILSVGKGGALSFAGAFFQKGLTFLKRTLETFKIWYNRPLGLFLSLLATFGNMAFIFLSIYFLIEGVHRHVSFWLIAGLWSLTYFVTLIPVSINGFGVQELSLTYLLPILGGLDHSESAVIAILIRLTFVVASLPGALFLPSILAEMNKDRAALDEL